MNSTAPATAESHPESAATQSLNVRPEDSIPSVVPTRPSSAPTTQPLLDSDKREANSERDHSTELSARSDPALADSQPAPRSRAVVPKSAAPATPAPRDGMSATRPAPRLSSPPTILFTGPGNGSKPFRLTLPERPIAASSSFAITSQLSVLVAPDRGGASAQEPARLQAGELVSFVWPRYPRPGDRHGSSETVKVRTTIGEFGQVLDVKRVSGSFSLLPAAISAIRPLAFQAHSLEQSACPSSTGRHHRIPAAKTVAARSLEASRSRRKGRMRSVSDAALSLSAFSLARAL